MTRSANPAPTIEGTLATSVLNALVDATAVVDQTGTIIMVNRAWQMFSLDNGGSESSTGVGINYLEVCARAAEHGAHEATGIAKALRSVLDGLSVDAELEYACPSPAGRRWFVLRITRLGGTTPGAVMSHVNITRRMVAEQQLNHAASHDPLTGLANRTLFHELMDRALTSRAGRRPAADVGLLFLDLDGFKPVNDTFGHAAGDDVLLTVAHRLRQTSRPGDTVARLGGDEFAILTTRMEQAGLDSLVHRVEQALDEPHRVHGQSVQVGASVGWYLAHPGEDSQLALQRADYTMYERKRHRQEESKKRVA